MNFAGWAKKVTGKPTITVGSIGLDNDMLGAFRGQSAATSTWSRSGARSCRTRSGS